MKITKLFELKTVKTSNIIHFFVFIKNIIATESPNLRVITFTSFYVLTMYMFFFTLIEAYHIITQKIYLYTTIS